MVTPLWMKPDVCVEVFDSKWGLVQRKRGCHERLFLYLTQRCSVTREEWMKCLINFFPTTFLLELTSTTWKTSSPSSSWVLSTPWPVRHFLWRDSTSWSSCCAVCCTVRPTCWRWPLPPALWRTSWARCLACPWHCRCWWPWSRTPDALRSPREGRWTLTHWSPSSARTGAPEIQGERIHYKTRINSQTAICGVCAHTNGRSYEVLTAQYCVLVILLT